MTGVVSKEKKQQILSNLARLGGETFKNEDVEFSGKKIILPEGSNIPQMIRFLQAKLQEDEEVTAFSHTFKYRPWDGAVALARTLAEHFGSTIHKGVDMGMFKIPPQLIDVPISVTDTVQVPWGNFVIPLLEDVEFTTSGHVTKEDGLVFAINAKGPKKWRFVINGIFQLVEQELAKNSIYRGKAFDGAEYPRFLDLSGVSKDRIIYSADTQAQLEASVFAPIRYPEVLDSVGVPIKRAVLLHGPYGTGKTSTAMLIAQEATENGWAFIYAVPKEHDLQEVLQTARLYQRAVVFFEDLDTIADPTGQQDSITSLLDMFDGFDAKGTEILAILTTNHPERIHKGMIRPGRLDAMIELGLPDAAAIEKIVRNYIPENMLNGIDWETVAGSMGGEINGEFIHYLPAFITESAGRALRYAIVRTNGEIENVTLETDDLVNAANGLRPQWEMMQDAPEATAADSVQESLVEVVRKGYLRGFKNVENAMQGDEKAEKELEKA